MSSDEAGIMITLLHVTRGNLCREEGIVAHGTSRLHKWAGIVVLGFFEPSTYDTYEGRPAVWQPWETLGCHQVVQNFL